MDNSFLTKYDIVELLGLNLTEEQKAKYIEELSDTCVKKAFYRLYREGYIEEELFNKIEPIILSDESNYDITKEMENIKKDLDDAIVIETDIYKKFSLVEQIEHFLEYTSKLNIDDPEIDNVIPRLIKSLNSSGKEFDELLNKYRKLKIQYKYESKA